MTKAVFVVQRYGKDIVGGAETLCRLVAENLVKRLGWSVTVYTTRARDYTTWQNEIAVEEEIINGVCVKRFKVLLPRNRFLFAIINKFITPIILNINLRLKLFHCLVYHLEKIWLIAQGPWCPSLVRRLQKDIHQFDKAFFFTYLYYPTIFGSKALQNLNFTLIPTAHNEKPFYFLHTSDLLKKSRRILVNIEPERELIETRMGHPMSSIRQAGLGMDTILSKQQNPKSSPIDKPFILYLGRVSAAKGLDELQDYFIQFKSSNITLRNLTLILVGKKDSSFVLKNRDDICYFGYVDEEEKNALIAHCLCIINPSKHESLSLITIEALYNLKPTLLNQNSQVLSYYCRHINTCHGYENSKDFIENLALIATTEWSTNSSQLRLLKAKEWVESYYSWPAIMKCYEDAPSLIDIS